MDDINCLCRLCGIKVNALKSLQIFGTQNRIKDIDKKINTCLPVKIIESDNLPKMICLECVNIVNQWFDFRKKVLNTKKIIMKMLKNMGKIPDKDIRMVSQNGTQVAYHSIDDINLRFSDHTTADSSFNDINILENEENPLAMGEDKKEQTLLRQKMREIETVSVTLEDLYVDTHLSQLHSGIGPSEISQDPKDPLELSVPDNSPSFNNVEGETILLQYSKATKNALLEDALNNPIVDTMSKKIWYACPFCEETLDTSDSLSSHFDEHFFCCKYCESLLTSSEALKLHNQECTKRPKDLVGKKNLPSGTLSEENNALSVRANDNDQIVKLSKRGIKECPYCGKKISTEYKLQEHLRKHTGEKPFNCTICSKSFRSKIGLAQHTASHTGNFEYNCYTCGKGFQCKSYLTVHQRVHSALKPYSCTLCDQNFKTKQALLDHENRHNGIKPYSCGICGRAFITKGLCKSHQKTHSGKDNRQFPCALCNKMFVSKSYLSTHLRIHNGQKPFVCETCGKGFLTNMDLKIHTTVHTGEKNFECDFCNKLFARRSALICHIRSHTGNKPYACEICKKSFTQYTPMVIHKRLHTGEKPYFCDVCDKKFVSRSSLLSHKKNLHKKQNDETKSESGNKIVYGEDCSIDIEEEKKNEIFLYVHEEES